MTSRQLRELGWQDFRDYDRPADADVVALASAAFKALCLDEAGNWRNVPAVIIALDAALAHVKGRSADEQDLRRLKTILDRQPVSHAELEDWFEGVYR